MAPQQPATVVDQPSQTRYFRVAGDWEGGGFAYTLPFADAAAAREWGVMRAGIHTDAHITVVDRGAYGTHPLRSAA